MLLNKKDTRQINQPLLEFTPEKRHQIYQAPKLILLETNEIAGGQTKVLETSSGVLS